MLSGLRCLDLRVALGLGNLKKVKMIEEFLLMSYHLHMKDHAEVIKPTWMLKDARNIFFTTRFVARVFRV